MDILPPSHVFAGLPSAYFRFIWLDPPWKFSAGTKGRPQHYPRMEDAEIAALPLRDLAHPDGAWVGCWVTSPKLEHVFRINRSWHDRKSGQHIRGWRAKYSGRMFIWIKTKARAGGSLFLHGDDDLHMGQGFTTRKNAEDLLLFKFGKPTRQSKKVREPIHSPIREHSRKPDEAFKRVEAFAAGPYVELFSREHRPGWTCWGNQTGLFDAPQLDLETAA